MPQIEHSIKVKATVKQLFELLKDTTIYKELIPDVKEVKILKNDHYKHILSEWIAQYNKFPIEWRVETHIDWEKGEAHFKQVEGDFDKYEGSWEYKKENGETLIKVNLSFELRIPLIGVFLKRMIEHRIDENLKIMLKNIKKLAEEKYATKDEKVEEKI